MIVINAHAVTLCSATCACAVTPCDYIKTFLLRDAIPACEKSDWICLPVIPFLLTELLSVLGIPLPVFLIQYGAILVAPFLALDAYLFFVLMIVAKGGSLHH
jgi:hypothetical protein